MAKAILYIAVVLLAIPLRAEISVSPKRVHLRGPESSQQLLVTRSQSGRLTDLTREVAYEIASPKIASIDADGLIQPLAEGKSHIVVRQGDQELRIPFEVSGIKHPVPVSFANEIIPIFTKAGCNSGGCHGKAEGQNGFKLSIFGFDPEADYSAITKQGRGRRVRVVHPEFSLLLRKGTSETPHGGGRKFAKGSYRYRRLRRWIAEGARFAADTSATEPPAAPAKPSERIDEIGAVRSIEVEPTWQVLLAGDRQQLQVTAIDGSGTRRCVTVEAEFESNAGVIAEVDQRGLIQASDIPGEAAILVRYMGHVAVSRITLPRPNVEFERPPENNFIDKLVWDKLQRLGIKPSGLVDDATFMRRAYLDAIGTLPTAAEARRFLTDKAADKRDKLVDTLLQRDEYADYWTMRWADILRADRNRITPQGTVAITRWLRKQFAANRPYDEFVRELLTVQGDALSEGPASFYKVMEKPDIMSRSVSQLFLGVRIECAQCHHHPSEKWTQADYVGLAGFFTGVKRKKLPTGGEAILSRGGTDVKHPRTGEVIPARALGAKAADFSKITDRRIALADWMTSADNPFFAKAIANRLWAHYLGRGLVEPIDDIRDTNPATNEPLMRALSDHLRTVNYDLKAFTRTLLGSRVYQLSSTANESNADDQQNFSHTAYRALPAEVLLDAICQATGAPEEFNGWPSGYRAIQIWDNRMPSYFFRIFGRPARVSVCECERSNEPSIAQALHLLNSPEIAGKIHFRRGQARRLADSNRPTDDVIDDLFLATLSRFPVDSERQLMRQVFDATGEKESETPRRAAIEDIMWALLNTKEFIFNH